MDRLILTVNTGSSSLKAALYRGGKRLEGVASFEISRIGQERADVHERVGKGQSSWKVAVADHRAALNMLVTWLHEHGYGRQLYAAGHRVVHGGEKFAEPQVVSDALVEALEDLVPIDPMHLPQAIAAIREIERAFSTLPQVACFDTSFHRTMPAVAQTYPLPLRYRDEGVIRYGFHGLSYEYVLQRVQHIDAATAGGRIVMAHLGNGASMAAVLGGKSIDTTMGFTPTGGLMMGTRSGDLDPGLMLYLLRDRGMSPDDVAELVNNGSGLLGVSGATPDMQDLLVSRSDDPSSRLAVDLFCYSARKHLAALSAALGGLDMLVFTGGIGEHSAEVRAEICRGLDFLGVRLDPALNLSGAPVISSAGSHVTVRVIATDEDMMIAEHTMRVLQARGEARVRV